MQITGSFTVPAPRQRVWEGLNDPEVLRQCIPGCEELLRVSDNEFEGKVVAKVGPVKAGFAGRVTLSDLDPPNGYTITGEGKGGVAGFAKGSAKVKLADEGAATKLDYTVEASVGGKLAQLGGRLVEAAANQTAEDFFARFSAAVSGAGGPAAEGAPAEAPTALRAAPTGEGRTGRLWLWIAAAVVVVAVIALASIF